MNTAEIEEALRAKYAAPAYATLFEVRNGTGFQRAARTADALIMSTWPSRGLELWGVEIKMSRSDWLRELKEPEKADSIHRYCDRWFLAVGDAKIVQPNELPPTWGLMEPYRDGLRTTREAQKLEAKPLDRLMLAAILRVATDPEKVSADTSRLLAAKQAEWQQQETDRLKRLQSHTRDELGLLRKAVAEFEKESGVQFNEWRAGNIGAAVKMVLDNGTDKIGKRVANLHEQLGRIVEKYSLKTGEEF